jgi:hypothetical protein
LLSVLLNTVKVVICINIMYLLHVSNKNNYGASTSTV